MTDSQFVAQGSLRHFDTHQITRIAQCFIFVMAHSCVMSVMTTHDSEFMSFIILGHYVLFARLLTFR